MSSHSSHRSHDSAWTRFRKSGLPLGLAVAAAVVVVVGGIGVASRYRSLPTVPSALSSDAAFAPALPSGSLPAPALSAASVRVEDAGDLAGALSLAAPLMNDTVDELDEGSALFALWAARRLTWPLLEARPETTPALYRKDPLEERGKRLCAEGRLGSIRAERNLARRLQLDHPLPLPNAADGAPKGEGDAGVDGWELQDLTRWDVPTGKVFFALVDTRAVKAGSQTELEAGLVLTAILVGSTGTLVDGDTARVCGVLTGVNLIKARAGSDVLAHRVVGMVDLPENRAAKPR